MMEPDKPTLNQEIGRRIHQLREDAGLSQEEFGRALVPPLTRAAVSNIEKGRQNLYVRTLCSIAEILKVPVTAVLPETTHNLASDPLKARIELQLEKEKLPASDSHQILATLMKASAKSKRNRDQGK